MSGRGSPIDRAYRRRVSPKGLVSFEVRVKETDLWIAAKVDLTREAVEQVLLLRRQLEAYIRDHPEFLDSLTPLPPDPLAPPLVRQMLRASQLTSVGPMAAVAGAISEGVGRALLRYSPEVIVENGGDIFMKSSCPRTVMIYAGDSPLSMKVGLEIPAGEALGVCTSSGTVGHSLSFGRADAVCVVSSDCALADAAATALANQVKGPKDIPAALDRARGIPGVEGVVIIVDEHLGVWGRFPIREV